MTVRKGRVLLGKLGEGHKEAQLNLAKTLGEAGFEVVFTELQDPESIVNSALQESVDHIGPYKKYCAQKGHKFRFQQRSALLQIN
jgi:methylmalonyl-CoA mutase cobalamin-binding domain/chain